jgi:hypothetical protein
MGAFISQATAYSHKRLARISPITKFSNNLTVNVKRSSTFALDLKKHPWYEAY